MLTNPDVDVRREILKEALLVRSQQGLSAAGPLYVAILAALAVTLPVAAIAWGVVGAVGGLALLLRGARGVLDDERMAGAIVEQVLRRDYAPQRVPPELEPYVEQSLEAACRLVVQAVGAHASPSANALVEVADTAVDLLGRMRAMCEQVITAEALLNSISDQFQALPRATAAAVEADFNRNLNKLQKSIDGAREQIFQTATLLQHMSVQAMLIQTQDFDLIDSTIGNLQQTATDQSELLQTRIQAMQEVAMTTESATTPLFRVAS